MSVSDENAVTPNCPTCGDTTPRGVVCLSCQPYPEVQRCQVCARRGPRPGVVDPPAIPAVDDPDGYRATAEYRAGQMPAKLG